MAAAGSRTLKLSLLADVAEFTKGIKTAGKDTESIGDQFTDFGKKAALAFAAAGAAIGAFAKQAIENAAADEKAQRNLALTIENTTNATAEQIKGVEKYISTTSLAIGITDDELRPAFARLTRSTKDVEEAQKLLNLALDISSATGKPLEAVANALGKAYDGNLTALGRLGLGIDQSVLKSKNFDLVFQSLTSTFGGFAENEADSTEKGFARIKIAVDELNEQIGTALLPIVQELSAFILAEVVPVLQQFVNGLTGDDGVTASLTEAEKKGLEFGKKLRSVINTVVDLKDELIATAAVIGTIFVVSKIAAGVTATIALIKSLIVAYNLLKASALVAGIASAFALNPLLGVGAVAIAAGVLAAANALTNQSNGETQFAVGGAPGAINGGAGSGGSTGGNSGGTGGGASNSGGGATFKATSGIAAAAASAARAGGAFTDSQNAARLAAAGGGGFTDSQNAARINLTVNGALDAEGTARTIVETLNNSYFRGTGGASNLQAI
jgi:hypothetical protein